MLVSMKEILDKANEENYAVPAPVAQTELNARMAIKCAEEKNAPLILNIPLIFDYNVDLFGRYLVALANDSSVPVAINHDHGDSFESAIACIKAGFSSIMVDRSMLSFEENAAQVKQLVEVAHSVGVSVEAELGHVGTAANYDDEKDCILTNPSQAKKFIDETGVDCLAVSIGTAHGAYNKGQKPVIDHERLKEIKKATGNFPLVLHGGSGTGDDVLAQVSKEGINKVNIGCELFAASIDELNNNDTSGNGAYGITNHISNGYCNRLKEFFDILGATNKAWDVEKKDNKRQAVELTEDTIL